MEGRGEGIGMGGALQLAASAKAAAVAAKRQNICLPTLSSRRGSAPQYGPLQAVTLRGRRSFHAPRARDPVAWEQGLSLADSASRGMPRATPAAA